MQHINGERPIWLAQDQHQPQGEASCVAIWTYKGGLSLSARLTRHPKGQATNHFVNES